MKYPLVSIIISCYNYAEFVQEAIASAANQTYKNTEIVVINDGSKDKSEEIIKALSGRFKFSYYNQDNKGIVSTRNRAIKIAKGEYLVQLDADDRLDENYIEETLRYAKKHKADIVYTNFKTFGAVQKTSDFPEFSLEKLKNFNYMHISSLVRTASISSVRFDEKLDKASHEDWDFFLGLCMLGLEAKFCPTTMLSYRIHKESRNNRVYSEEERLNYVKTYKYIVDKYSAYYKDEFDYLLGKEFAVWYEAISKNLAQHKGELDVMRKANQLIAIQLHQSQAKLQQLTGSKAVKLASFISKAYKLPAKAFRRNP